MFLIITNPHTGDYGEFFELTQDLDIQKEFLNFEGIDLFETIEHLKYWIKINDEKSPNNLNLIKIGFEESETYTKQNSKLI